MTQLHATDPAAERDVRALAPEDLEQRYREVRGCTESLCAPLAVEDQVVQSMDDASPTKWHRAHTTWFFETFVLQRMHADYRSPDPRYAVLFNSYYNAVGEQFSRPRRGLLTRPTVVEVDAYRAAVDARMLDLIASGIDAEVGSVIELGLHHEQQHQELILTDIKHAFSANPLAPVYRDLEPAAGRDAATLRWCGVDEGVAEIGHAGDGFAFDNEGPRHRVFLRSAELASRPVTCGEYLAFIEDGGYRRPELWLSDGWSTVQRERWQRPLYWSPPETDTRSHFTLGGVRAIDLSEPVTHVSFYEADAFARWSGCRLPTEAEWEVLAANAPRDGNFVESGRFHPEASAGGDGPTQMFGDVWEWTSSAYSPYPGFAPPDGALGEYNAKFMCSQIVLRGGSCATPRSHLRPTYRNFFPPATRWQFAGLRLARDA